MSEEIDLEDDLQKLAHSMLEAATLPDVKLSEKLEVFKILGNYSVNISKVKGRAPPGDLPSGPNMSNIRAGITAAGAASKPEGDEQDDDEQA